MRQECFFLRSQCLDPSDVCCTIPRSLTGWIKVPGTFVVGYLAFSKVLWGKIHVPAVSFSLLARAFIALRALLRSKRKQRSREARLRPERWRRYGVWDGGISY